MNIGVTGPNGYVGKALVKAGCLPLCFDVTKPLEIEREVKEKKPDIILHLAAKSDPDWCEKWMNRMLVSQINVRGTHNVFYRGAMERIPCVLMSTGQIWKGGFWERNHREYDKKTEPVNIYGLSKLAAESIAQMCFDEGSKIIRSSFIFDANRLAPKLGQLRAGEEIYEPTFIRRSFIYLQDFVELVLDYCKRFDQMPNTLHLAGSGTASWFEFMREVAYQYGYETELVQHRWKEENGHAPRPNNAGLNTRLAHGLGLRVPNYVEGIKRMRNES